jgi:putative MATE family efflux protein
MSFKRSSPGGANSEVALIKNKQDKGGGGENNKIVIYKAPKDENRCKREVSVIFELLKTSLPMSVIQLIQDINVIFGAALISRGGKDELTAASMIFPIQNAIIFSPSAILFAVLPLASRQYGASKDAEHKDGAYSNIRIIYQQGKMLALFTGTISIGVALLVEPGLQLFKVEEEISSIVGEYFKALCCGIFQFHQMLCSIHFANGTNDQIVAALTRIATMPLLIVLGYGMVFGELSLPKLGPKGYAYAYAIQTTASMLLLDLYLIIRNCKRYNLLSLKCQLKNRWNTIKNLVKTGLPLSMFMLSELLSIVGLSLIGKKIGDDEASAQGVCFNWATSIFVLFLGLQNADCSGIGKALGAGKNYLIRTYDRWATILSMGVALVPFVLSLVIPKYMAAVFFDSFDIENAKVVELIKTLLPIYMGGMFLEAVRVTGIGSCLALRDTLVPTLINILTLCLIGVPLAYLYGLVTSFGAMGVAAARNISLLLAAAHTLLHWRVQSSKKLVPEEVNQKQSSTCSSIYNAVCGFFYKKKPKEKPQQGKVVKKQTIINIDEQCQHQKTVKSKSILGPIFTSLKSMFCFFTSCCRRDPEDINENEKFDKKEYLPV